MIFDSFVFFYFLGWFPLSTTNKSAFFFRLPIIFFMDGKLSGDYFGNPKKMRTFEENI